MEITQKLLNKTAPKIVEKLEDNNTMTFQN